MGKSYKEWIKQKKEYSKLKIKQMTPAKNMKKIKNTSQELQDTREKPNIKLQASMKKNPKSRVQIRYSTRSWRKHFPELSKDSPTQM